jgi:hypothetical protein
MKFVHAGILIILFCSCKSLYPKRHKVEFVNKQNEYRIDKIDSVNNWYLFYASKRDSLYKIVVRKNMNYSDCKRKLRVGKYYDLLLQSTFNKPLVINGTEIVVMNPLDVNCHSFDEETYICIDPKKGIYDLYYTTDVIGMCYVK